MADEHIVDEEDSEFCALEIPKNVSPVNELEEFFRKAFADDASKQRKQLAVNALFDVLCGQACNVITEECSQDRVIALYELAAQQFTATLESYPKKLYVIDNLMVYLPEQKFPDDLLTYLETMQSVIPPVSFWGRNTRAAVEKSDKQKQMTYFGSKVWKNHQECKRMVNNHLNSHWKSSNLDKSGVNESAVYLAIRQQIWRNGLRPKAVAAVENSLNYTKKKLKDGKIPRVVTTVDENVTKECLITREQDRLLAKGFDDSFYPREWAAFILLGKPAGDRALTSYLSGTGKASEATKRPFTLQDFQSERAGMSKQSRQKTSGSGAPPLPSSRDSVDSNDNKSLVITIARTEAASNAAYIDQVEKRIKVLQMLIDVNVNVEENNVKLIECYIALEKSLEAMTRGGPSFSAQSNYSNLLNFNGPIV